MKILLVHASAGAGHQKCAEAVYRYLKNHRKDASVELVDLLDYSSGPFRFVYRRGYSWVVNRLPWLWGFFYWASFFRPLSYFYKWCNALIDRASNHALAGYFCSQNPEYIISPHFLPPEIAVYLKKKKKINSRIITVITDLGIHPYWINEGTDLYVVHSEFAVRQLAGRGIPADRILASGIPVDSRFLEPCPRKETAGKYGLDPREFTVLIATGSFGLGPIDELVRFLHPAAQVIVVCGRNQELFKTLTAHAYPRVKVFGFIDTMHELMSCADLMLTKAGGLSVTECLSIKLVPLFIAAIPGQESQNIQVVVSQGAGIDVRHLGAGKIADLVIELKDDPSRLAAMRDAMAGLRKPSAAGDLVDALR